MASDSSLEILRLDQRAEGRRSVIYRAPCSSSVPCEDVSLIETHLFQQAYTSPAWPGLGIQLVGSIENDNDIRLLKSKPPYSRRPPRDDPTTRNSSISDFTSPFYRPVRNVTTKEREMNTKNTILYETPTVTDPAKRDAKRIGIEILTGEPRPTVAYWNFGRQLIETDGGKKLILVQIP
jgi:hypothetical protein